MWNFVLDEFRGLRLQSSLSQDLDHRVLASRPTREFLTRRYPWWWDHSLETADSDALYNKDIVPVPTSGSRAWVNRMGEWRLSTMGYGDHEG